MAKNIKKEIKKNTEVSYLNKDFDSFRSNLVSYANQHYGDKIIDFSQASFGGLMVDMASYVGDSLSFYLNHQFNELFLESSIERQNTERHIRESGIKIRGSSPATVIIKISIRVPAIKNGSIFSPNLNFAPVIKKESIFTANNGIEFTLLDDVDFRKLNAAGDLIAAYKIGSVNSSNDVQDFVLTLEGVCTSAKTKTENFTFPDTFVPFRTITLGNSNVGEIISVIDTNFDEYYEVESLTQDTVYRRLENSNSDSELVPQRIVLEPAPRRFTKSTTLTTGRTTLRFGAGNEDVFDEDIVPDPSLHAVSLYGDRKTFQKSSIDPNSFLGTSTLGISPKNTTLTVRYRHGGGLRHNVSSGQISFVKTLITTFNSSVPANIATAIRSSTIIVNESPAFGGENEPTLEELRIAALLGKNSQNRIVTREDLISRVYDMPTNFGRVFRVSVRDNPNNPMAAQLHVISRDTSKNLIISPDSLKENLVIYLSRFRLISDAIDVLDAEIINMAMDYTVTVDKNFNPEIAIQNINARLSDYFNIENFQIDQPIIVGEVENLILNSPGVVSILNLNFKGRSGVFENRIYSNTNFSVKRYFERGFIFPTRGGIFEFKFPNDDIVGKVG